MRRKYIAIVLGIVFFVLIIAIFIQMKTVENMNETVNTGLSRNSELIDEVFKLQEKNDSLYKQLEDSKTRLEKIRTQALSGSEEDTKAEEELKENNLLLGLSEMKGEGIIIILDDNRNIQGDELNVSQYLVHEEDLLQVVNELFNAGAEAISINEQRVVNSTSILCDGNIIRVNGKVITVPITVKAISSTAIYNTLIRPKGYLQIMADEGVEVKIDISNNIVIPKYDGVYNYSHLSIGGDN